MYKRQAIDRGIEIGHIHLVEKNGGASGHYQGKSYLNLKDDKNNGSDVDNVCLLYTSRCV